MNKGTNRDKEQLIEKMVSVNRVTKVVKGGRIMAFAALTVVGDMDGSVGIGKAKAKEVPIAVQKSLREARKNMVNIPLTNGTIYHEVHAKYSATKVFVAPASDGTGIIAGGVMRAIFEAVGILNITAKIYGSTNPHNVAGATLKALLSCMTPIEVADKRDKDVKYFLES